MSQWVSLNFPQFEDIFQITIPLEAVEVGHRFHFFLRPHIATAFDVSD